MAPEVPARPGCSLRSVKTSTVLGVVLAVLFSFAAVSAAAGYLWARADTDRPATTRALPAQWPSKDARAVRSVPMPTGEMIAALPPDTAGNVLCGALSQERWQALLGGRTLLEVRDGGCHLVTNTTDITLSLASAPGQPQDPEQVDIHGHDGSLEYLSPYVNTRLDVRLVPENATEEIKPYLHVELNGSAPALDELTEKVADAVVDATTQPGPSLPSVTKDGAIPLQHPAPASIVDTPWPVISWQLCTALSRELGGTGKPAFDGRCTVRGIQAAYTDSPSPLKFPDQVAGRPALVTPDRVTVQLGDDAQQLTLTGSGHPLKELADTIVPRLLGR